MPRVVPKPTSPGTPVLGELLKAFRLQRGLSQRELSDGICFRTYISEIEQGDRYPTAPLLAELAERLQVPLAQLADPYLASPMNSLAQSLSLARQLAGEGSFDKAADVLERCKGMLEQEPKPQLYEADLLETQGIILFKSGRPEEAVSPFQKALQLRRRTKSRKYQLARSLFRYGLCALHLGDTASAEEVLFEAYHTVLWLDPAEAQERVEKLTELNTKVVQTLGYLLLHSRNVQGALHVYRFARARWSACGILAEPSPDILLGQSIAEMGTGNLAQARQVLTNLLNSQTAPDILGRVHTNLGVLDRLEGNWASAVQHQRLAWRIHTETGKGESVSICNELVRCALHQGDIATARSWLERARSAAADGADHTLLAETYLLSGKLALAEGDSPMADHWLTRAQEHATQSTALRKQIRIERARLGLASSDHQCVTRMLTSLESDLGLTSI